MNDAAPRAGKPPRKVRTVRMSEAGIAAVQSVADRHQVSWGEAARRMLTYAATRMPDKPQSF